MRFGDEQSLKGTRAGRLADRVDARRWARASATRQAFDDALDALRSKVGFGGVVDAGVRVRRDGAREHRAAR